MAKNRYISTSFWDDTYITKLDPIEKLVFNYCLTNPLTSICGIYEISIKRIGFDTGLDREMAEKILKRFEDDKKMKYENGWLAIKNFIKHQKQNADKTDKVSIGIEKALDKSPVSLKNWIFEERIPLTRGGGPNISEQDATLNYLNFNSNLNSNSNNNAKTNTPSDEGDSDENKDNQSKLSEKEGLKHGGVEKPKQKEYSDIVWNRYKEITGVAIGDQPKSFWSKFQRWVEISTLDDTKQLMNIYDFCYNKNKTTKIYGGNEQGIINKIGDPSWWIINVSWIRAYNLPFPKNNTTPKKSISIADVNSDDINEIAKDLRVGENR